MSYMMKNARILYVEDDESLSFVTRDNLERAGYTIEYCGDGITAFEMIRDEKFDLYILDVMLPKIDGFTLARKIREKDESAPILFLSAKSTIDDKIFGFQLGADDYITKPFNIDELILKIEVFLKRSQVDMSRIQESGSLVKIGEYIFSPDELRLYFKEEIRSLTHKESELLLYLYKKMGAIVRRNDILLHVWGNDHFFSSRSLDVFISRLRKLLGADPSIRIENIHNIGYRFMVQKQK